LAARFFWAILMRSIKLAASSFSASVKVVMSILMAAAESWADVVLAGA
jgi:hypothetical protein